MDTLYAHLHRWMAEPFVWGQSDCMLVLADYLVSLGHSDIGAKWRGTYDSALSCQRVSGFLTDPVRPLAEGCASIGLPRTDDPQRGDIGVIRINVGDKIMATGAIFLGGNWAVKGERSVVIGAPMEIMAAWRVAHA